jgi:uncharacterized protein YozE (UPF0346 family)
VAFTGSKIAATLQAEEQMARDGSSSPVAKKKRELDDGAETVIVLSPMLYNGLLISTQADSSAASRGVTAEGANQDQSSTPAVADTDYFSKLPQELKDSIHDHVMWDKVGEDGEVKIMGLADGAYVDALKSPHNQADFNKAFQNVAEYLRTHRKFKATCHTADDVSRAWERYAELKHAVASSRSSPHKCSFRLVFARIARDMLCALAPLFIDETP